MKLTRILPVAFVAMLCLGCTEPEDAAPVTMPETLIECFEYKAIGKTMQATIDTKANTISMPGVTDGSKIISIKCKLADGVTISPNPESRLSKWLPEERFSLSYAGQRVVYTAILTDYQKPSVKSDAQLFTQQRYGRVTKHLYFDLKDKNGKLNNTDTANDLFINQDFDGLRVPIWGVPGKAGNVSDEGSGHPAPGEINEAVYEPFLIRMRNARAARGSGDFGIFASPKVDFEIGKSFPSWTTDANGKIIPERYAQMVADFFEYMDEQGFKIDVLGVDNEGVFNQGKVDKDRKAAGFAAVIDNIREKLDALGLPQPRIIAPESWDPKGASDPWLKNLITNYGDRYDIYGVHYYPDKDHPKNYHKLKYEIDLKGEREFWASEPHWQSQKEVDSNNSNGDMLSHSERAISCLWAQTDLGMDAFMWWAYGTDQTLRSQLMKVTSVHLHGAQPIRFDDHDGSKDVLEYTPNTMKSRAFIEDNKVTLYLMNMAKYASRTDISALKDYAISIEDAEISGDIKYEQWSGVESSAAEYTFASGKITPYDQTTFMVDLPVRSITCLQFDITTKSE